MKNAEEEAKEARAKAEFANHAKSTLLVNMSHELRTPLNAIIGFFEILKAELFGPLGSERYRDYAKDVHNAGTHLLALINDLLDISKIELGETDFEETEIRFNDCLDECVTLIRTRAAESNFSIELDTPARSPLLWADVRRVKQIVLNITGNAVKFSPEGGGISIKGSLTENGECQVTVTDSGPGIPETDIRRITEPFYQTQQTYQRTSDGVGLGLSITQSLCTMHGAELSFESNPGRGTTVRVTFPPDRTVKAETGPLRVIGGKSAGG